jgi:hypothetical protein
MPLQDDTYLACNDVAVQGGVNAGAVTTGVGPVGRVFVYDIVPLALLANNLATSQSPGTAALTLAAGTGVTTATVNGQTVLQLDVPRILRFVSGGNDTGITFNVVGYDFYGQPMHENVTGASNSTASGAKAWWQVLSITPSAGVSSTITVGTGDVFGLPFYLKDKTYALGVQWNNTLAKDTGTLTTGVTTTPSATTGDVRGTYAPSTGASDGTKRLVFAQIISAAQTGASATRSAILGATQF